MMATTMMMMISKDTAMRGPVHLKTTIKEMVTSNLIRQKTDIFFLGFIGLRWWLSVIPVWSNDFFTWSGVILEDFVRRLVFVELLLSVKDCFICELDYNWEKNESFCRRIFHLWKGLRRKTCFWILNELFLDDWSFSSFFVVGSLKRIKIRDWKKMKIGSFTGFSSPKPTVMWITLFERYGNEIFFGTRKCWQR